MKLKFTFLFIYITIQILSIFINTSSTALTHKHKCINDHQLRLINNLKKDKILISPAVEKVMCSIDRGDFASKIEAYQNQPAYIKYGATLSLPGAHARALEIMYTKFKDRKNLTIVGISYLEWV